MKLERYPRSAPRPTIIYFLPNGNTVAFDADSNQIPFLSISWFESFLMDIENYQGLDATEIVFVMPNAQKAIVHRLEDGENTFNWEIQS